MTPVDNSTDARWQGWDSPAYEGLPEGFSAHDSERMFGSIGAELKTAPAGNRGLTTTTAKESNDG